MTPLVLIRAYRAVVLGVVLLIPVSGAAIADEWSVEPSVSLKEEYNDNVHMTTSPHPVVWGTTLSPSVTFRERSATQDVSGGARINFNRYSGETGLDTTDHLFTFSSSYKMERNSFGLDASLTRDSTITEWEQTGYLVTRKQRRNASVSPSWTTNLSELLQLKLSYSYSDVSYETAPNLTNYTFQKLNGVLQYFWSERDQLFLVASDEKLNYADNSGQAAVGGWDFDPSYGLYLPGGGAYTISQNNSQTRKLLVGMSHAFSDTLSGVLKIGSRTTKSSAVYACNGDLSIPRCTYNDNWTRTDPLINFQRETKSSGSTFDGSLTKQFENASLQGTFTRDLNVSGNGLVETTNMGISAANQFSDKMSGSLNFSAYQTRYLGAQTTARDSRYLSFQPRLSLRLSEWWTLGAGYGYAKQKYDGATQAATSNSMYVNLSYIWPKVSVSR